MTSSERRSCVRYGRSAGARVPRASARRRVARGGRGLLRGHGFACRPTAAGLRTWALACAPPAARLRAGGARVRASGSRFASAFGTALGPRAPAVCLRYRAQPSPLRRPRPVEGVTYGALRPMALVPSGSTPSAPATAARASVPVACGMVGWDGRQRVVGPGSPPCLHRRRQAPDETPPGSRPRWTCDPLAQGSRSREVRHGSHSARRTSRKVSRSRPRRPG